MKETSLILYLVIVVMASMCGYKAGQVDGMSTAKDSQRADTTITIEVSYDSIHGTFQEKVPVPYLVEVPGPEKWHNVDTGAILQDYFSKYLAIDQYSDSIITFWIQDTITQNRVASRKVGYELVVKREKEVQIITNEKPLEAWFYSGSLLGSGELLAPGAGVEFVTNEWSAGGMLHVPVTGQKPIVQLKFSKRF